MAQLINNPNNAMRGLEFAIGAGRVPWGGGGAQPILQTQDLGGGGVGYDMGPAGPGIQTMGVGGVDPNALPNPSRIGDGAKPPMPAIPGAGGPGDVAELSRKVKDLERRTGPVDGGSAAPPILMEGGMGGPGNSGPIGPSRTRRPQGPPTGQRERARRSALTGLKSAAGPMMY